VKIERLKVTGFRGFNRSQEFYFEPGLNVFYGPNGVGKTSVAEAIEWLLFGDTSKLRFAPSKLEYRDSLSNLHYDDEEPPHVEGWFTLASGAHVRVRRELVAHDKSNLYLNENTVDDLSEIGIQSTTMVPVVAQHSLKEFIHSVPAERWKAFSRMLGLDNLSAFRANLSTAITQFQRQHEEIVKRMEELVRDIRSNQDSTFNGILSAIRNLDVEMYVSELKKVTEEFAGILHDDPVLVLRNYRKQIEDELVNLPNGFLQVATSEPGSAMTENRRVTEELLSTVEEIISSFPKLLMLGSVRPAMERIKFLKQGLGLPVHQENLCPFCGEPTFSPEKRENLESEIKRYEEASILHDSLERQITTLTTKVPALLANLRGWVPLHLAEGSTDFDEWLGSLPDSISSRFQAVKASVRSLNADLSALESEMGQALTNLKTDFTLLRLDNENVTKLTELLHRTVCMITRLEELGAQTKGLYEACIPHFQRMSLNNEKAVRASLLIRLWENRLIVKEACAVLTILDRMRKLKEVTENLEKRETEVRLQRKQADALQWYNLLNPAEDVRLSAIQVKGSRTRQVDLIAELYGKKASAAAMLSEAHINATGLSVYLSQIVTEHSPFRFVILDDPVQSMDENHTFRFQTDLVTKLIAQGYQVIILSHLKTFTDGLRTCYNLDTYYEFYDYSIEGPLVRERSLELQEYIKTAIELRTGTAQHRALAASSLRKATERLCKMIYNKQNSSKTLPARFQNMTSRDLKALVKTLIAPEDIGKVNLLLAHADPASHDDTTYEPPSPGTIDSMVDCLVALAQKYVDQSFKRPKV
jgi:DNA repair exonuclease SbcCD ATPase subunit